VTTSIEKPLYFKDCMKLDVGEDVFVLDFDTSKTMNFVIDKNLLSTFYKSKF